MDQNSNKVTISCSDNKPNKSYYNHSILIIDISFQNTQGHHRDMLHHKNRIQYQSNPLILTKTMIVKT